MEYQTWWLALDVSHVAFTISTTIGMYVYCFSNKDSYTIRTSGLNKIVEDGIKFKT